MTERNAEGNRVYRNPLTDIPDQWLFFAVFLVGAILIWTLKSLGVSQKTTTVVPLLLMGAYVGISVLTKRYRIREDKVGDNIYYLGFLFTLVSLAYALYSYQRGDGGAAEIITNFGIAISTTILGLAGRVFFNQMREDPLEYEREARYSLAEASNSMKSQLGDISREFAIFKRKLLQIIEEGAYEVTDNSAKTLEKNVQAFSTAAANITEKVNVTFAALADQSAKLNAMSSNTAAAMEALLKRIEDLEKLRATIEERVATEGARAGE